MSQQRSVLILGYRQGMVEACRRMGIHSTTLVDPWEEPEKLPPCGEGEDRIFVENLAKDEMTLCALASNAKLKFDAVCTSEEYFVVNSALLSLVLSKPYMEPKVAVAFRDKFYQKSLLRGTISVTDSWLIQDIKNFSIIEDYPYPVILKPVAGAGTRHTYLANNCLELHDIIEVYKKQSNLPRNMVLERFVTGEEWHVDGWISKGELQMFSVSKYGFPLIGIKNGGIVHSATLRPEINQEIYEKLRPFLKTTFQALGLENGVFHLEMFFNNQTGEFVFSECGARIGGGLVPLAFRSMFGIDLYEVLVKLSLGQHVETEYLESSHSAGWTYLPSVSEHTKSLPDPSLLMSLPGVKHIEYSWTPGQKSPDTRHDTTKRTGMVLVIGEDECQVKDRISHVLSYFSELTQEKPEV